MSHVKVYHEHEVNKCWVDRHAVQHYRSPFGLLYILSVYFKERNEILYKTTA